MRKALYVVLAFALSAVALPSFAYTNYTGQLAWLGTDWAGNGYRFALTGVTNQCAWGQFSLGAGAAGYKDQVATLMLAWSLGEAVTVTTDATDSCANNRANIISVQIPGR